MAPPDPRLRWLATPAWLLAMATTADASADNLVVWDHRDIVRPGLASQPFVLDEPASLHVVAVSGGHPRLPELLSYGWILDARTREVVWIQTREDSDPSEHDRENFIVDRILDLPAGSYVAYFSATDRTFPGEGALHLLGRRLVIRIAEGQLTRWNALGDVGDWRFRLSVADADYDPADLHVGLDVTEPELTEASNAVIRFAPLGDEAHERVGFRIDEPLELAITGCGEYDSENEVYVDRAAIQDALTREVVWAFHPDDSWSAGGAEKNHRFDSRIVLEPGSYVLTADTDDSHSFQGWNDAPPFDPEAWGVTLSVVDPADHDKVQLARDPREERVIARIDRVGSASYVRRAFVIERPVAVWIEGLGEQQWARDGTMVDYGWLETLPDRTRIWTMDGQNGEHAGGRHDNRRIGARLQLEPGIYALCYVTDGSHAYRDWSGGAPDDPSAWGITVFSADPLPDDEPPFRSVDVRKHDPAVISLAPTGDSTHRQQEMTLHRPYRLRVVVIGEGLNGRMYDHGWIEDVETGRKIWQMTYQNSVHAGGASKNRMVDEIIELAPGRYRVHYVTDDSHSFEDWNQARPDHPELWGLTLYQAPPPEG